MRWHDLLFLHWPLPAEGIRPLIPESLEIDIFDESAWIGVVPFYMTGVRLRPLLPLPHGCSFAELNVRTYVRTAGRPGVWFFSLDAGSRIAVWVARRRFRLPYFAARITVQAHDDGVRYRSIRVHRGVRRAEFEGEYRPIGPVFRAPHGSLDHWLTERYRLYTLDRAGRLAYADIHHAPWPLQPAQAKVGTNSMLSALGLSQPSDAPLLHFARRLDVVAWRLKPLENSVPGR